ncbi:polysaccharide pyruvyl transferase family protein [Achromobacter sp.]|uniref:polysaccharide pyruvyl transferase family protein n=1 Tax=Achromobacter sp. TaxID=134375 RepID=UPI00289C905E|nr:polysaccharide pyruvyl transferase family protein [Achromobacter sp.]
MYTQKIGYLEFRYGADPKRQTANVGDSIQSIAVRRLLKRLAIDEANIVGVDRDSLKQYAGPPVKLIMNGCFNERCFPLPSQITPIFFGFNAESESVITKNKELFKRHQPIGCRDNATKQMFDRHRITAYVTGCATLTLDRRTEAADIAAAPVIAFGAGSGVLQQKLLEIIPKPLLEHARLIYQREPVREIPLSDDSVGKMNTLAHTYLDVYTKASVVVTPLLHVASPCVAMGIPVVLARRDRDDRFTAIDRLLPVYTPTEFSSIDWRVRPLDIEPLKSAMLNVARHLLDDLKPADDDLATLSKCYASRPVLQPPKTSKRRWRLRNLFGKR